MKYSVGDMFVDKFNEHIAIIQIIHPFSSESWKHGDLLHYAVTINGRKSNLKWYDHDFTRMKNITCPVLKALYEN